MDDKLTANCPYEKDKMLYQISLSLGFKTGERWGTNHHKTKKDLQQKSHKSLN